MKIIYILTLWDEKNTGGRESYVRQLVSRLEANNEIIVVVMRKGLRTEIIKNDKVKFYKLPHLNIMFYEYFYLHTATLNKFIKAIWYIIDNIDIVTAIKILAIIKKENPDVVHLQDARGFFAIMCWLLGFYNKKIILTVHTYELLCLDAMLLCAMTKFEPCKRQPLLCKLFVFIKRVMVFSGIHTVIFPSNFILEMYNKQGFFRDSKKEVIPNFVETKPLRLIEHGDKMTLNILYIGRLSKEKGVDILIGSFKAINRELLKLHIIGTGTEEIVLKHLAAEDKRIIFHGLVEHEKIGQFYEIADFVIVPSICYESFSLVIVESFSFGLPVIGSRIGGIPELVKDGETGLTFNPGDSQDLTQKIEYLINNQEVINNLGAKAREFVEKKFNFEDHYHRLKTVYEGLIRNG